MKPKHHSSSGGARQCSATATAWYGWKDLAETGKWEAQPYFSIDDQFPFGHGEKSVFLIERFLRLKPSEAVAIRWHMGGFDDAARGGSFSISQAYEKYPLAVKLHLADVYSTYLKEKGTSVMR